MTPLWHVVWVALIHWPHSDFYPPKATKNTALGTIFAGLGRDEDREKSSPHAARYICLDSIDRRDAIMTMARPDPSGKVLIPPSNCKFPQSGFYRLEVTDKKHLAASK